jgi:uncharacterized membrane protein YcjF (UPF0283 family)
MVTSLIHLVAANLSTIAHLAEEDAETVQTADMGAVGGFIVEGLVAVAAILLILDMVRRMRRTKYREQVRAELAEEIAANEAAGAAPAPDANTN